MLYLNANLAVAATNANTIIYADQWNYERYFEEHNMFHDRGIIRAYQIHQGRGGVRVGVRMQTPNCNPPYMIVDGICDGGVTLIKLVQTLQYGGADFRNINLYVSHGIFSMGINILFDAGINRIFTSRGEQTREDNDGTL